MEKGANRSLARTPGVATAPRVQPFSQVKEYGRGEGLNLIFDTQEVNYAAWISLFHCNSLVEDSRVRGGFECSFALLNEARANSFPLIMINVILT